VKSFSLKTLIRTIILSGCVLLLSATGSLTADDEGVPEAPVPGKVTMVDLGAKRCIPCKMMAPIIEELKKEYKDRAAIIFIDVWEHPGAGVTYGIQLIPTQIFYDAHGKEMSRHEGFMDKAAIVAELQKLGVK
jgi:thioredoxin 1